MRIREHTRYEANIEGFPDFAIRLCHFDVVPRHNSPLGQEKSDQTVVLVGAGDIADCSDLSGTEATAKLLEAIPGTVFTAGDNAYEQGTAEQFAKCYDPTWGRQKARTHPSVGNHEFHSGGATAYFDYFGPNAGDPKQGYYSYELGSWHIIVLNSECAEVGGCNSGSAQEKWLRADLQAHPSACTLAYWHKPLFSSGAKHGNDLEMKPFWKDLYAAKAAVLINGRSRLRTVRAPGSRRQIRFRIGIREFVVGTGGKNHRPFAKPLPTSEVRDWSARTASSSSPFTPKVTTGSSSPRRVNPSKTPAPALASSAQK